jgi:hypothetical protein
VVWCGVLRWEWEPYPTPVWSWRYKKRIALVEIEGRKVTFILTYDKAKDVYHLTAIAIGKPGELAYIESKEYKVKETERVVQPVKVKGVTVDYIYMYEFKIPNIKLPIVVEMVWVSGIAVARAKLEISEEGIRLL